MYKEPLHFTQGFFGRNAITFSSLNTLERTPGVRRPKLTFWFGYLLTCFLTSLKFR